MLEKFMARWAAMIHRNPWKISILSILIAICGAYLTSQLALKTDFATLLPENAQSVKDLHSIADRMGGMGTLMVQLECDDLPAMERFADDLVGKLSKYPKAYIKFIDYRIDLQKKFFEHNRLLYLKEKELSELRDGLKEKIDTEKLKASGMWVDLDDDEDEEDADTAKPAAKAEVAKDGQAQAKDAEKDDGKKKPFDFKEKRKKYEEELKHFDKYKDGYLTSEDGKTLLIVIKTPGTATGVDFAREMVSKVTAEIEALKPQSYHPSLKVTPTGDMQTLIEEYYSLRDDILIVSNLCVFAVFVAVALYYRSIRMALTVGLGELVAIFVTFGITKLQIGYLTTSTAFLASIVAGNGINFGIYFRARYMEEHAKTGPSEITLVNSMTNTIHSVATAALAAGVAYASLMLVDFRGFNQFGFIGGVGMLVSLVVAFTVDPAVVILMDRHWPFKDKGAKIDGKGNFEHGAFSRLFAWIVESAPKTILFGGTALILASTVALALFLRDPYEYDYKKLRNQISRKEGSGAASNKAEKILGERSSPHIILADRIEQVQPIKDELLKFTSENPDPEKRVIKNIKTVFDSLPGSLEEQARKLVVIGDIRRIIDANDFSFLDDDDKKTLDDMTPPTDLRPLAMNDLPPEILRPYIETNGTRGTPVLVYMADGMSVWNGHDLMRFAAAVRSVKLANGEEVRSSGHAVIFSDMLTYIANEGPSATWHAFVMALIVILIFYRRPKDVVLIMLSMTSCVLLMMGTAILLGQKINFLNYIAIPIQFGIGVDYCVNPYQRFLEEGPGSVGRVLRSTGSAVMIAALTTIIGYSALWFSLNGAINSFGTLANIGEFAALALGILIVPAFLIVFRKGGKEHLIKE